MAGHIVNWVKLFRTIAPTLGGRVFGERISPQYSVPSKRFERWARSDLARCQATLAGGDLVGGGVSLFLFRRVGPERRWGNRRDGKGCLRSGGSGGQS